MKDFSFYYYLSNNINGIKRPHEFFKHGNTPTFFKIQENDSDFKAKLVRGNVLFKSGTSALLARQIQNRNLALITTAVEFSA